MQFNHTHKMVEVKVSATKMQLEHEVT